LDIDRTELVITLQEHFITLETGFIPYFFALTACRLSSQQMQRLTPVFVFRRRNERIRDDE
jgi:hypothetical protein